MCVGSHVQYLSLLPHFNQSKKQKKSTNFTKNDHTKFRGCWTCGKVSRSVRTERPTDGRTDIARIPVARRNCSANALKISVRTSQRTHSVHITKTNRLMLHTETVAVCCHTERVNTACASCRVSKHAVHTASTDVSRVKS